MPESYGLAGAGPGEADGMVAAGLPVGETRGVDPSSPGCFGAIGFPIAINSETVTNLNRLPSLRALQILPYLVNLSG